MNKFLIRASDILLSLVGLILLAPFMLLISVWITLDSTGPVIFRQNRVGKNNRDFILYKFRTMVVNAEKQGLITVGTRDSRITRSGAFLRKFKLDELPQLWNVLIGDMSLVGPRPEVRKYVDLYTPEQRIVLSVRPGITDLASIVFSNENEVLSRQKDPDTYYIQVIMPEKIRLNLVFIEHPSWIKYLSIIFKTIRKIAG